MGLYLLFHVVFLNFLMFLWLSMNSWCDFKKKELTRGKEKKVASNTFQGIWEAWETQKKSYSTDLYFDSTEATERVRWSLKAPSQLVVDLYLSSVMWFKKMPIIPISSLPSQCHTSLQPASLTNLSASEPFPSYLRSGDLHKAKWPMLCVTGPSFKDTAHCTSFPSPEEKVRQGASGQTLQPVLLKPWTRHHHQGSGPNEERLLNNLITQFLTLLHTQTHTCSHNVSSREVSVLGFCSCYIFISSGWKLLHSLQISFPLHLSSLLALLRALKLPMPGEYKSVHKPVAQSWNYWKFFMAWVLALKMSSCCCISSSLAAHDSCPLLSAQTGLRILGQFQERSSTRFLQEQRLFSINITLDPEFCFTMS